MKSVKYVLMLFLLSISLFIFSQQQKMAEHFVSLLETHDYWERANKTRGQNDNLPTLADLRSQNPLLNKLESYNRIHMDYGNQGKESDPNHDFTILELRFRDSRDIPFSNNQLQQIYSDCAGTYNYENLSAEEKERVFPLWEFKELEHSGWIRWEHREYITWHGIRDGATVFLVYTIPVSNISDLKGYFDLLTVYLSVKTDKEMVDFIDVLKENKSRSRLAYDAVADLQEMLDRCGIDPGPVDGYYGGATEKALIKLLVGLEYMDSENSDFNQIREALGEFQKTHDLFQTGRFENETIEILEKVWVMQTNSE